MFEDFGESFGEENEFFERLEDLGALNNEIGLAQRVLREKGIISSSFQRTNKKLDQNEKNILAEYQQYLLSAIETVRFLNKSDNGNYQVYLNETRSLLNKSGYRPNIEFSAKQRRLVGMCWDSDPLPLY